MSEPIPVPAHLRADAPRQQCSSCKRWTVATSDFGTTCGMPQPSGQACDGVFHEAPGTLPYERPATLADMHRFWPDKTTQELTAAADAIEKAGGVMTVVTEPRTEVTHGCPRPGEGVTTCCGRIPLALPLDDRLSADPNLVTCTSRDVRS